MPLERRLTLRQLRIFQTVVDEGGFTRAAERLSLSRPAVTHQIQHTSKSIDLRVRPIRHRLEDRVRAHLLLCMLAYYVQWHLVQAWRPLLFRDEEPPFQADPVAPAERSAGALRKARSKAFADGSPVHDFHSLLGHLGSLTRNRMSVADAPGGFSETLASSAATHAIPDCHAASTS